MQGKIVKKFLSKKRVYKFNDSNIETFSKDNEIYIVNSNKPLYIVNTKKDNYSNIRNLNDEKLCDNIVLHSYKISAFSPINISDNDDLLKIINKFERIALFPIKTPFGVFKYRYDYHIDRVLIFYDGKLVVKIKNNDIYLDESLGDIEFLVALVEATNLLKNYVKDINSPDDVDFD